MQKTQKQINIAEGVPRKARPHLYAPMTKNAKGLNAIIFTCRSTLMSLDVLVVRIRNQRKVFENVHNQ